MIGFRTLLGVMLGLALATETSAQLLPPSRLDWQRIRTEHFDVYFARGSEALAERLAATVEITHDLYRARYGLTPGGRVNVFLQESYNLVNSAAAVPLHRSMYIFPDPPYGVPYAQFGHHGDWLELAVVHEYAHMVDLDLRAGLWKPLHVLTGAGYPNVLRPLWTIEGFATWAETAVTGGGRVGAPSTEMVMRSDHLAGRLRQPVDWSGAPDPWPGATLAYLYGGSFLRHLEDERGAEVVVNFRRASARTWPWTYGAPMFKAGASMLGTLASFQDQTRQRSRATLEAIERRGPIVEGETVAKVGTTILDQLPTRDGRRILLSVLSDTDAPALVEWDLATSRSRRLRRTRGLDVRIAESPTGLIISDLDILGGTRLSSLFLGLDRGGGSRRRVSTAERLHEPAVGPDGTVWGCQREAGRSFLVRVDATGATRLPLNLPPDADVFHPSLAPDGRQAAVSVWSPPGRQDLWWVDLATGAAHPLTDDEHWDISPAVSPDGESVVFASDRSGVWNIYRIEVASRRLQQITNVTTGAFLPEFSADGGTVTFSRYTAQGDELRRVRLDEVPALDLTPPPTPQHREYLAAWSPREAEDRDVPTPSNAPWWDAVATHWPILHVPLPSADERGFAAGLTLVGAHPLARFSYQGTASWGFESERVSYSGRYGIFGPRGLLLTISAQDQARPLSVDVTDLDRPWRRDRFQDVSLTLPVQQTSYGLAFQVGGRVSETTAVGRTAEAAAGDVLPDALRQRRVEVRGGWSYSSVQRHALSFSPENGLVLSTVYRQRLRALRGRRDDSGADAEARVYRRLHPNLVVAARALAVAGFDGEIEVGPYGQVVLHGLADPIFATQAGLAVAEVRFRIAELQRKVTSDLIYLNRLHGAIFAEGVRLEAPGDPRAGCRSLGAVGARLSLDFTFGYLGRSTLSVVGALGNEGEGVVGVEAGSGF